MLFESCTKIKTEFFSGIGGMTRIRKDVAILARGQGSRKVEEVTYGCLLIYIYYYGKCSTCNTVCAYRIIYR